MTAVAEAPARAERRSAPRCPCGRPAVVMASGAVRVCDRCLEKLMHNVAQEPVA